MADALIAAVATSGLRSGGTISFHHHLRNGDNVVVPTIATCARLGLRDLHLAASSLFPCHGDLIPFVQDGTITRISTAYMNGRLADAVSQGAMAHPVTLQTHGGRARAIVSGEMLIDLAIVAAPALDPDGNIGGADGANACGPLGYAMVDAAYAGHVLAVTDSPTKSLHKICIPAAQVDQAARVASIGDASGLASGTTARQPGADGLAIADLALRLIEISGALRDGLTFQAGAGAVSLAVARGLGDRMAERGVTGAFAAGGITQALVEMQRQGLFRRLVSVQSFDRAAVADYAINPNHIAISADDYANPDRADAYAHRLDVMVLGAAEIDTEFNVNVTTTSQGRIIGGSGGHADTAAGARLAIVTMPTTARGQARIVANVRCLTTPGSSIDALVTERGIAFPPHQGDLENAAIGAGLPVRSIHDLMAEAGPPPVHTPATDRIIALSQYRDGTIIDRLHMSG